MEIILEGQKMLTKESFHKELKEKLQLPDYYGNNLDALWDCLTGWVSLPIAIHWKDFSKVRNNLGLYADKASKLMLDAQKDLSGFKIIID